MIDKIYVPPIKIQGIKTKLVPLIKKSVVLREDNVWIEPFMGSGVVGFNIRHNKAVFADINPHVVNFYNSIKVGSVSSIVVREFLSEQGAILSQKDADYYYEVRERFNKNHDPLDFLFLNRSCFNGMIRFNKNYDFNVPYGHKPQRFSKAYITKIVNQVAFVEYCLRSYDWTFVCQSFEKTIQEAPDESFIYCDPPYIGRHVDYYDSWDEESEQILCESLRKRNVPFMLSTWDHNEFRSNVYINSIWKDCKKLTQNHFYHIGAKEENRNPMIEALLINYKQPEEVKYVSEEGQLGLVFA
ncbi:MAG: Dam family site-specific DNA-(adenine-N6)-methyltransferase [Spirochaetia bacterium]|nr:Dam family site-specific DNA-(adenine-N6)-methyltransferase [Spirochaetia bacterium]